MAHKEDLLFCKIAIAHGLVTQEQAQKVLALCSKRERVEGRRPRIGAVFNKYKLIGAKEAQAVYVAVDKRLSKGSSQGRPAPAGRRSPSRAGGSGGGARSATRHARSSTRGSSRQREYPDRPRRAVDPQTMWMGIGFGVLFLGVILTIAYLFMSPSSGTRVAETAGGDLDPETSEAVQQVLAQDQESEPRTLDGDRRQEIRTRLDDVRRDVDDGPERGLANLEELESYLTKLEQAGYDVGEYITRAVELRIALGEVASTEEDPAAEGAPPPEQTAQRDASAPVEKGAKTKERRKALPRQGAKREDDEISLDDFFE